MNQQDVRATQGIDRLEMVTAARLIVSTVMYENKLDVLVTTNIPAPVEQNEFARDPVASDARPNGPAITDLLGVPEIIVPSGYDQVAYDAKYALSRTRRVTSQLRAEKTMLPHPLPISLMFWGGPGDEPRVLRVASAYVAATQHRVSPADFGPLDGEPVAGASHAAEHD